MPETPANKPDRAVASPSLPPSAPPEGGQDRRTGTGLRATVPVSRSNLLWPLVALAAILLFNLLLTPGFFRLEVRDGHLYGSLVDILNRAVPVMLLALGMTLVLATGGVDLSVGAVMAITGAIAAQAISRPGSAVAAVLALSLVAALAAGVWNGLLVALLDIQPIVATLVLMVAGRGVAQLLTNGQIITFHSPPLEFVGAGFFLGLPFPITIVLLAYLAIGLTARLTALGLFVEAVGNNATASRFAGINTTRVKLLVYALSGLCAGIAGLIITADIKAADANNIGMYSELDAILAAVIGGTSLNGGRFNLLGSLVGAVLIQSLTTTILTRGVPVEFTLVVKALVVIAVCLLQSDALKVRMRGER